MRGLLGLEADLRDKASISDSLRELRLRMIEAREFGSMPQMERHSTGRRDMLAFRPY